MLVNYKAIFPIKNKDYERPFPTVSKDNSDAVSEMTGTTLLTANTNTVAGTDGKLHEHITCHVCHIKGHYSPYCATRTMVTGSQHLQMSKDPTTMTDDFSHTPDSRASPHFHTKQRPTLRNPQHLDPPRQSVNGLSV
jgi:hypothetical protein